MPKGKNIGNFLKSEFDYLKNERIFLAGKKADVAEAVGYFQKNKSGVRLTILCQGKADLVYYLKTLRNQNNLRYMLAKLGYINMDDGEFNIVFYFVDVPKIADKERKATLADIYTLLKPSGIAIVFGKGVEKAKTKLINARFEDYEFEEYNGTKYLKLVKVSDTDILPQ
ncbi:hypothetical protein M1373_03030 [Candidatus Marsarchaeota archaeon]|nr:hypothetical protein [Candidatus Marsarchaeota archaeon]MCL5404713.1 hypothetical protein [Candidatus Marsarchaeota archaeon]